MEFTRTQLICEWDHRCVSYERATQVIGQQRQGAAKKALASADRRKPCRIRIPNIWLPPEFIYPGTLQRRLRVSTYISRTETETVQFSISLAAIEWERISWRGRTEISIPSAPSKVQSCSYRKSDDRRKKSYSGQPSGYSNFIGFVLLYLGDIKGFEQRRDE